MTSYDLQDLELSDFDLSGNNPVIEMEIAPAPIDSATEADEAMEPRGTLETTFDYSGVSEAVAAEAEEAARKIRDRLRGSIIDTGSDLIAIKEKLRHGKFGAWLTFHFNMSERTAQNFMNAAAAFADTPRVVDLLPPATIYKLAAKGAPAEIRQFVIEGVANGITLDQKEIESRIATAQNVERQKREDERAARQEQRAWQKHEQTLRDAGKPDDEIENERKRWATKKAQKERAAQQKSSEAKQREEAASHREEKMKEIAARVAKILKARLGSDYEKLRDALLQINYGEFRAAMQQA